MSDQASTSNDIESVVRARLRGLRLSLGWSLDDLAHRTHVSASTISRLENGKRTLSLDLLQPLCVALQIDLAMTAGTNQPMGPLALADRIGLDTVLAILTVLHEDLGDPKFRPCPLLRQYVEAGRLGRKSGRGFYEYEGHDAASRPA